MSALPPKATSSATYGNVRYGPKADSCSAAKGSLVDYLVGAASIRLRPIIIGQDEEPDVKPEVSDHTERQKEPPLVPEADSK